MRFQGLFPVRFVFIPHVKKAFCNNSKDIRLEFVESRNSIGMSKLNYYTEEGLERLKAELHALKTKGRSEMARQIADARDKGDLSENAEYDAAKDAQGLLELKISKLEETVGNARVIKQENVDTSKVSILSRVKIKNASNGASMIYTLVAEEEADLKAGKISVKSPIGRGLLGKKVGDLTEISIPSGKVKFEIQEIGV
jgi:transcription elongation factor GreA